MLDIDQRAWWWQRTRDGRAWEMCQFLPASFSPSAPLGFTFDSVACQQCTVDASDDISSDDISST